MDSNTFGFKLQHLYNYLFLLPIFPPSPQSQETEETTRPVKNVALTTKGLQEILPSVHETWYLKVFTMPLFIRFQKTHIKWNNSCSKYNCNMGCAVMWYYLPSCSRFVNKAIRLVPRPALWWTMKCAVRDRNDVMNVNKAFYCVTETTWTLFIVVAQPPYRNSAARCSSSF